MADDSLGTPIHPDQAHAEQEQRIREWAYELWQADGAPEGRAEEYWHRARELMQREPKTGSLPSESK
jgi:hypothetical protein